MIRLATAALLLGAAVPAAAVTSLTYNFGGTASNANAFGYTQGGITLTATARKFTLAPGSLTNLGQTTATGLVSRSTPGIGVDGGASSPQIDTNQIGTAQAPLREALLLSGTQDFSLAGLSLSFVDVNDTLKVYGVRSNGVLVDLGYGTAAGAASTIAGGLNGAASSLSYNAGLNSGTATFGLAPTDYYTRYLFTTRVGGDVIFNGDGGQGYRIDSLTAAVPEAQTWALLVIGFGMVGAAARRRKLGTVAA